MPRPCCSIAVVSMLMWAVGAQAQQSSVSSNRLMFDPNGLGTDSRKPATSPQATATPATTTGQSVQQQQPAARQTIAPSPQAAPGPAPRPAARAGNSAPTRAPAPRRPTPAERSVSDATANTTRSADRPIPREQTNLGRVALPQGSLGYESRTQMQTYDLSDGRRVPGFENIQRNDSSYFGLSLRMPTANSPSSSSSSPSWSSSPSSSSFGSHGAN